jgi:hypothetical protein
LVIVKFYFCIKNFTTVNNNIDLKYGGVIMESNRINESIGCIVHDCKYHAGNKDYCTLEHIHVTQHTNHASEKENTDCGSFESKR